MKHINVLRAPNNDNSCYQKGLVLNQLSQIKLFDVNLYLCRCNYNILYLSKEL